jgi:uncharacterized protein (TIGR02099 family)
LSRDRATPRLRHYLDQFRAIVLTALAVLVIATAVLVGIGRALIPYADELRPWLAETLSDRIGQDVRIGRLEVQWPRLTPKLILLGASIGPEGNPLLDVDQARLELHLPDLFSADRNPFRLIVLGLDLVLAEDEDGQWGLRLEGGARVAEHSERDPMLAGDLLVRDARLRVQPKDFPEFGTRLVEGEIRRRGEQTLVQGLLEPAATAGSGLSFGLLLEHPGNHWTALQARASGQDLIMHDWLNAPWLPEGARLSVDAWLEWSIDDDARLDLELAVDNTGLASDSVMLEMFASRGGGVTHAEVVALRDPAVEEGPMIAGLALARNGRSWALEIDSLDLEPVFKLVEPLFVEVPQAPTALAGRLHDFSAGWHRDEGLYALRGRASGLMVRLPDPLPDIQGLDLVLGLAGDRPVLVPSGQPRIEWPFLLRETVSLDALEGRILLSPGGIELDGFRIENDFLSGTAHGWIYRGERRPFLDLVIEAERVEAVDPRPWLPPRYVPERALAWLDESLSWVGFAEGHVVLHMRAGKQAADIQPGDFQAEVNFAGLEIDYWPDWPAATAVDGWAEFVGSALSGRIDDARIGELPVSAPELEIANLTEPLLLLQIESGRSDAGRIAQLMATLPIPAWETIMAPMSWAGPAQVDIDLELPFAQMQDWWISGQVQLDGADLALPIVDLSLSDLEGMVSFDRERLGPSSMSARSQREPLVLDLEAGFGESAWLRIESILNPASLVSDASVLSPLAGRVHGASPFRFVLSGAGDEGLRLEIVSQLEGLALNLPAPLDKQPDISWPLAMEISIGAQRTAASVRLSEWLVGDWLSDTGGWRLGLGLNRDRLELPGEPGVLVRGSLDHLALPGWIELFTEFAGPGAGPPPQVDVDLMLESMEGFGLELGEINLEVSRGEQAWRAQLAGDDITGHLTIPIPLDSGRVLVADLQHLYLDPFEPETESHELGIHPISAQTSTQSPLGLPPLHLLVEDLRWGDMDLGRARVESHAVAEGMEIEMVDVSGPDLRLNGRGRWVARDDRMHSEFQGRLMTGNLSGLLSSAGYDSGIEASRAQVDADLRWPGSPMDFALGRLSGSFDLRIFDGTIPEARPGAGRLLGLASFSAIPRRLMLDFRDVFGAGLKFDEIEGGFALAAGFARTNGLVISAPAANITITGDTDMAARTYNQIIVVEPGLGATLPIIGILAGGPAGAAAGLVLRSILDRPLRGIAEARYSVTGPWDDPVISLVEARVTDEEGDEAVINPVEPD